MDKPKHKDGMLAAGKKRLQQFRQKKQSKGGSSKEEAKSETDIEHGRMGSDVESGPSTGTQNKTSNEDTPSSHLETPHDRSDTESDGLPIDLRVVRADDIDSPSAAGHGYLSGLPKSSRQDHVPGSFVGNLLEPSPTLQQHDETGHDRGKTVIEEVCLRMDVLEQSSTDVQGNLLFTSGGDHSAISMASDLRIAMNETVVPKANANHDLLDDVGGTAELNEESSVMNPETLEYVEAVQKYQSPISNLNASVATVETEMSLELAAEVTCEDHSTAVSSSEGALHQVWQSQSTSYNSEKHLEDAVDPDNGAAMADLGAEKSSSKFDQIREVTNDQTLPNSPNIDLMDCEGFAANKASEDVPGTRLQMDKSSMISYSVEDGVSSLSSSSVIDCFQSEDKLDGVSAYGGASSIPLNLSLSQAAVDMRDEFEPEIVTINAEGQVIGSGTQAGIPVLEVDMQSLSRAEVVDIVELQNKARMLDSVRLGPLEKEKNSGQDSATGQVIGSRNEVHTEAPVAPVHQADSDVTGSRALEEGHQLHDAVNSISDSNLEESASSCESHGNTQTIGSPDGAVAMPSSYVKCFSEEVGEAQQAEERENTLEVLMPQDKVLTNIQDKHAQGKHEESQWEDQEVRESATFLVVGVGDVTILGANVVDDIISNTGPCMELDSAGHEAHELISSDSDSRAVDTIMDRDFELRSSTGIVVPDVDAGIVLGSGPESPPGQVVIDESIMNEVSDRNLVVTMAGDALSTWESPSTSPARTNSLVEEIVAEAEVKKEATRTKMKLTFGKDEEHLGRVEAHSADEVADAPNILDGGGGLLVTSSEAVKVDVAEGSNHPKEEPDSTLNSSYASNTAMGLENVLEQGNDGASSGTALSSFHREIPILNADLESCVHDVVESDMPLEPTSNSVVLDRVVDSESDVMLSVGSFSTSYSTEQDGKIECVEISERMASHAEVELQPCLALTSQIDLVISGADPSYEVMSLDGSLGNDESLPPPDSMHGTLNKDSKNVQMELLPPALDPDASQSGGKKDSMVVSEEGGHSLCKGEEELLRDGSLGNDESLPPLDSMHGTLSEDSKNFLLEQPRALDPDASQSCGKNDSKLGSQESGHSLWEGEELLRDMKREQGTELKVDDEVDELMVDDEVPESGDFECSRNETDGLGSQRVLRMEDKQPHEILEEKTRLECVIKELEDSLRTQEVTLEKLTNDHNCQTAKTVAERDSCMQILTYMVTRLRHLVYQDSKLNDGDILPHLSLVESGQVPESVNLDLCRHVCDSWIDELSKGLEDKWQAITGEKQLEDLLSSKDSQIEALAEEIKEFGKELETSVEERKQLECQTSRLQELLCLREADLERLSNEVLELARSNELAMVEVSESRGARLRLEDELKDRQKLHVEQEASLSKRVLELSEAHDLAMAEVAKLVEDRSRLEGEVSHLQKVNEEQDCLFSGRVMELSQNYDLALGELGKVFEERASLENEVKHLQEMHSRMHVQAGALSCKVSAVVGEFLTDKEAVSGDTIGILDLSITSLLRHCETICRDNEDLQNKVSDSEAAYESLRKELALAQEQLNVLTFELNKAKQDGELDSLRTLISVKDVELGHLNQQVSLLKMELSKTREEGETKLQEAEQKLLGVRERLSMAVTKGKGLVQQRDNLKQLLAEKTAELEAMASSYKHELRVKTVALEEVEIRVKLNSEAVERVEALESELSYIRNSANTLRESFLQKDAVLQKIEELLEDASLPEELQIKDTFERIEWLLEAFSHKRSPLEGQHEDHYASNKVPREMGDSSEQALLHMQEVEQLNRKCDDLLRKYRGMAEQSAMLEQSLLERNLIIQRWEELLDAIDIPASVRTKEPENKIEWLGMAVSDAQASFSQLQAEMESMQAEAAALNRAKDEEAESLRTDIGALNQAVERLQEENLALSGQILAKDVELKRVASDLEEMTLKFNFMSTQSFEESTPAEVRRVECEQENLLQFAEMEALITSVRNLVSQVLEGDAVDKAFSADFSPWRVLERAVEVLVDSCKAASLEATETRRKLDELSVAASKSEREKEKELQGLHEAQSLKSAEIGKLTQQLEELVREKSSLGELADGLREQVKAVSEELASVREELGKSRLEVGQGEEKLTSVREKLSMAVKKGKSVVQQRDAVRQSLEEKTAELGQLLKERESESLVMAKVKQSLQHHMQQVEVLEAELGATRDYASGLEDSLQESNRVLQKLAEALDKVSVSGAPRSADMLEKMQWVSQHVIDLQRKAGTSEQEAKKSRRATELLALELEEMQARMDSLSDELTHAEKNISILIEEKKVAEASKAEAGLRLEHAMANLNSLLYELNESRDSLASLQHENASLKESLSAQLEEIRNKQTKADSELKEMTQLHNEVHVLRDHLTTFLSLVANQVSKSREGMEGTKSLVLNILEEFKDYGAVLSPAARAQLDNVSSNCGLEFPMKVKMTNQDWKQGVTSTVRLLCEEMKVDLQNSRGYLEKSIAAPEQETAALSRLLLGIRDVMLLLRKEADAGSSSSSLIMEKEGRIRALEEVCKLVVDRIRTTIDELEASRRNARGQAPRNDTSPHDVLEGGMGDLQAFVTSLLESLSTSARDYVHLFQQLRIQGDRESELLKKEVSDATAVIELMGQQQQVDKLKISELRKQAEEFEVKEDTLKKTNEELYLLHDALAFKRQEEEGLLQVLSQAEAKIRDLSAKVEELEKAKQELEASLAKASHRFQTAVNSFNKFQSLSEKLIEEAQSLHLLLEDRDAEIALLKEEVAARGSQVSSLKDTLTEKNAQTSQVLRHIRSMVESDAGGSTGPLAEQESEGQAGITKELLEALAASIRAGPDGLRVQLARKDALLQDVQMRNDDLARKVALLESSLLENQRLLEESGQHVAERSMIMVESEEVGNRGKHSIPSVAMVTHGRSGRKVSASDHLVLDMESAESSRPLIDLDNDEDKGHVFRPLTSSGLVPRGTRFMVDRLDGFWVSGERLLRRRPGARLSVMLYWLVLHVWMVALLL